ncbi:MAG: hypothetical protein Q8M76_09380, partial [Spirochaetaceae bacterium]|nr:hypothetical protein [Spirochaetaceae bacterium]
MTAPASGVAGTVEWADALLTSGSESLLGAVRNYLGPVKTPYDKRELVRRLELFLRRLETQDAILALLDPLDARILGACLILGPIREHELKELFVGEIPLFELGVRIANLYDRLLLFRVHTGGHARGALALRAAAVTPLLEQKLRERIMDAETQFGLPRSAPNVARDESEPAQESARGLVDAAFVTAFFSFLFHSPAALRKGGGLTKRGIERALALFPRFSGRNGEAFDELSRAFGAAAVVVGKGEDKPIVDRAAFAELLSRWGGRLPFYLAAALAQSRKESPLRDAAEALGEGEGESLAGEFPSGGAGVRRQAELLARALEAFPSTFVFSPQGLERWLRIAARLAAVPIDGGRAVDALRSLGVLAPGAGGRGLVTMACAFAA